MAKKSLHNPYDAPHPPYKEPNGEDCYWSRGNGWAYAALVRVLEEIPADEVHRTDYVNDFLAIP